MQLIGGLSETYEFESVDPELEDVYFSVMAGHHGRRRVEAAAGAEGRSGLYCVPVDAS